MEMKKMELETEIKQMEAKEDDILILGIESSCDETAASVVRNGRTVLQCDLVADLICIHCMAVLYRRLRPESILNGSIRWSHRHLRMLT